MRRRAVRTSESPMSSKPSATSCIEPLRLPVGGSERTVVVVGVSLSHRVVAVSYTPLTLPTTHPV